MPSTVIRKINYEPKHKILRVVYVSGSVYDYLDVPERVYLKMKEAFSKGTFLNKYIKGNYSFKKISE